MSDDEHPSDDDENWFAKERARTNRDSSRRRAAGHLQLVPATVPIPEAVLEKRKREHLEAGPRNRIRVDHMRDLIVRLKASSDPANEHDLIAQIKAADHPDLEGLLRTLLGRAQAAEAKGTRPRKDKGL